MRLNLMRAATLVLGATTVYTILNTSISTPYVYVLTFIFVWMWIRTIKEQRSK